MSHLFDILEPNLVELNISERTLTSFSSVYLNLIEFTEVKKLVAMVTMKRNTKHSLARLT
jgi:hypothetical protein